MQGDMITGKMRGKSDVPLCILGNDSRSLN